MHKYIFDQNKAYTVFVELILVLIAGTSITLLISSVWKNNLLLTHSLLEMVSILIAFSTFIITWNTFHLNSYSNRVIGFGCLIICVCDVLHTFFFQTSVYEFAYCLEISTKLWVIGRIVEAIIILSVCMNFPIIKLGKIKSTLLTLFIILVICLLTFLKPYAFRLWIVTGMTTLKIILEFVVAALLIVSLIVLCHRRHETIKNRNLFIAITIAFIAELNFTFYKSSLLSFHPALGHVLRIFCYIYLFRGVFVKVVEYPYKKIENALNLSETLFETAFYNAPIGMAIISVDGNWLKANDIMCEILAYPRNELLQKNFDEVVGDGSEYTFNQIFNELIFKNKRSISYEKVYGSVTGENIWTQINISLIKDDMGIPIYLVAQIENISDKKRAAALEILALKNETIIKENTELERLRTDFFANLSHEFRTPLNVILSALKLMQLNISKEQNDINLSKISSNIYVIKQNCLRLLRLINNLIDITKIDAGFYKIDLKNENIINIVEEITMSVAQYIKDKGIQLIFDTDTEEKIIACDPDKIERIILNIISNSLKYTEKGGLITINMYDRNQTIEICIKDTGVGIPEDKLGIIFERFRQADNSTTRCKEGSGIGLSLVKSLVEMHSGTVSISSKPGHGCMVTISLPVKFTDDIQKDPISSASYMLGHVERLNVEFSDIYFNANQRDIPY